MFDWFLYLCFFFVGLTGPGGVLSNAVDVARWLQMLLNNGRHPITNATIIPAEVLQAVSTGITVWDDFVVRVFAPELSPAVYGGAQVLSSYRGHGFHSEITRFPNDGFGVAVLTNDDPLGMLLMEAIKYRIVDEILGLDVIDWNSRCVLSPFPRL
ncbi:hypothetical protein B0H10DRAFT_1791968 [Mycena sp. CBHHK59/15]|nr:hypothetical protein B0H10DRAFT_1791968 [Mycena sp. CBHHK59/15]